MSIRLVRASAFSSGRSCPASSGRASRSRLRAWQRSSRAASERMPRQVRLAYRISFCRHCTPSMLSGTGPWRFQRSMTKTTQWPSGGLRRMASSGVLETQPPSQ